jgi:(p)ppGpp synthase/HD superfamily hydrolase
MAIESILDKVKEFADSAHGSQMRRYSSERYIVHPVRVMETCKKYTDNVTILSAALLHDVLEDTPVTKDELKVFLHPLMNEQEATRTVELVTELTDVFIKEKYPKWNRRKRKNKETDRLVKISPEAQTVKYADIIDNAPEITTHDPEFANRFLYEYRQLLRRMNKGDAKLYKIAIETVYSCYERLKQQQNNL